MKTLPKSPDLSHLKRQAKQLLRDAHAGEAEALKRFATSFPAMRAFQRSLLSSAELQLHDAQSVITREYGFDSWPELKRFVQSKQAKASERLDTFLRWIYEGTRRDAQIGDA